MSEQPEAFSLYAATTRELLNRIGQDHPYYANALMYQQRLQANIRQSQSQGDTDELKTARCRIINELNKLAMCTQGLSFRELYAQIESQKEQQAQYLPNISDPLRLAKLDPESTVHPLLEAIEQARSRENCEAVLGLCDEVIECASAHGSQTELALAYLYRADALARSNLIEVGIGLANRARQILELRGHRHNTLVARLLLARLQAAQGSIGARLEYLAVASCCQKLESENKAAAQKDEIQLYGRMLAEVQLALDDGSKAAREQYIHRYLVNPIPVLQLSDGPEVATRPSQWTEPLANGDFRILGQTYFLYLLDEAMGHPLELQASATHFALPVREDGWLGIISKEQDYALVRKDARDIREGAAVSWADEEWIGGQFARDANTGRIHFVSPMRDAKIIGNEHGDSYGHVVGLFKYAE